MSDDEAQAAKDKLATAIREYWQTVEPGVYIESWALVVHKLSTELEAHNATSVGHLTPTGQPWPMTVGILRIAANGAESPWVEDDE